MCLTIMIDCIYYWDFFDYLIMAPPPEQHDATAVKDILSQLSQDKTVLEEVRKIALRVSL